MNLLIVAATTAEITPLIKHLQSTAARPGVQEDLLITGVGMLATAYSLTRHLQAGKYDLVIQAGVGGSYDRSLQLGDVVFIISDGYGDMGAEDHDDYIDIFEMGLIGKNEGPHREGRLDNKLLPLHDKILLPNVTGLTVNTVSGSERTIARRAAKYNCQVESMEGAAFHYVCMQEGVAFAQVRGISNYVTPRDRSQWKMKEAVISLNNWLIDFIETL